jgi:hypothetical protein
MVCHRQFNGLAWHRGVAINPVFDDTNQMLLAALMPVCYYE